VGQERRTYECQCTSCDCQTGVQNWWTNAYWQVKDERHTMEWLRVSQMRSWIAGLLNKQVFCHRAWMMLSRSDMKCITPSSRCYICWPSGHEAASPCLQESSLPPRTHDNYEAHRSVSVWSRTCMHQDGRNWKPEVKTWAGGANCEAPTRWCGIPYKMAGLCLQTAQTPRGRMNKSSWGEAELRTRARVYALHVMR